MDSVTEASSSSATTHQSWTYDVFLSFRGDDTRNNIVSHLHSNLVRKGIRTFLDDDGDDGLKRGVDISIELHKAIEVSKVSIIVFSENYASSRWCLEELVKILDCKESKNQMVYPVFYKVDPSDVRNQNGTFGKALADHQDMGHSERVVKWKEALTKAGNMSGKHFLDGDNESRLIDAIMEEISAQVVRRTYLNVANYPVGIEFRVQDVLKLLRVGEDGVLMVGIWGVGGIGKTTLAKAVYNSVAYQFEDSCFLANVREEYSMTSGGPVSLQRIIISEISGWKTPLVTSVAKGITLIKELVRNKRLLLILDDVDHLNQLKDLVENPESCGPGSRIIITTRDKHCLTGYKVKEIYKVEKLSHHEAFELFNLNAFQDPRPLKDYVEVVKNVLLYAQGLPLALEVLAANLRGRDVNQWKYALDSYRSLPKLEIQEVLKISYHALEHSIKEVFLHIACFFKGKSKEYVTKILEACNVNPEHAIAVLEEKSLIVVTEENTIQMHDLIEEMGQEIVIQESPEEPGQRSRLWRPEDVYNVFAKNRGSDKLQFIVVNNRERREMKIRLTSTSFSMLKNLQVFITYDDMFTGDHVNYLSNKLRVLYWPCCPLLSFPSKFSPMDLVIFSMSTSQPSILGEILFRLKMPWAGMSPLGKGVEIMRRLKYINFSYCPHLRSLGDFSRFPNLVDLNLRGCINLVEVTIGCLQNLVTLNLSKCEKLKKFVIMRVMKSLKCLDLSGTAIKDISSSVGFLENIVSLNLESCEKLEKFELMQDIKSLKCLDLSGTAITDVSSSIGYLISLEWLTLRGCTKLTNVSCSIFELQHLRHVDLFSCDSLVTFPSKSESSTSLQGTHYGPLSISLDSCKNLQKISEFPREICYLNLRFCCALKQMSKLSNILKGKESKMISRLNLFDCYNLSPMKYNLLDNSAARDLLSLILSCQQSAFEVLFPSRRGFRDWHRLPSPAGFIWSEYKEAYRLKIEFSADFNWENKGLAFCADKYISNNTRSGPYFTSCTVYINGVRITEPSEKKYEDRPWRLTHGHVWIYFIPFHTVIRRLGECGLPPPSTCLVQFKLDAERGEEKYHMYDRYVVVPGNKNDVRFTLQPKKIQTEKI